MKSLKEILICRDGLTNQEAQQQIDDAKDLLEQYAANGDMFAAMNICEAEFGLEADYLDELMMSI